jgi:hypothetical protein
MAMDSGVGTELPRWKCHKIVHGFKITRIELDADRRKTNEETDGSALLHHGEGYFTSVKVDSEYLIRHKPEVGGYYVVYDDGYLSYSPAKAFEEGYTRL